MNNNVKLRLRYIFGSDEQAGIKNSCYYQLLSENCIRDNAGICCIQDCKLPAASSSFYGDIFDDLQLKDTKRYWSCYCYKHKKEPVILVDSGSSAVVNVNLKRRRNFNKRDVPANTETEFCWYHELNMENEINE